MSVKQYTIWTILRDCATGKITIGRGYWLACMHGCKLSYDAWQADVEKCKESQS
jgi:hypothetical protein